jgi:hypothetical protein
MTRIVNSRPPKAPQITVIGEGITEQFYFKHIRAIFGFHYIIKPYYFDTTSLKEMDRKIFEVIEGYGIAICVFDTDVARRNEKEQMKLNRLKHKYQQNKNVIFCDSLPSIEFWFLIHYRNTNQHFENTAAILTALRSYLSGYQKSTLFLDQEKWVKDLCADGKLESAIQRARDFGDSGLSYSNIYKAFDLFTIQNHQNVIM